MPAERPIFLNEPTRKVVNEPKPVAQPSFDRDGQMYFWDNILEFPETWTIPSPQMPIIPLADRSFISDFRKNSAGAEERKNQLTLGLKIRNKQSDNAMHWPEEDIREGTGISVDPETIPPHYIKRNQDYWRRTARGRFSRVMELRRSGGEIHRRIEKAFGLPESDPPITTWSVFIDRQKNAISEFTHRIRFPEGLKSKEDKKTWLIGIGRLTEYVTNYATIEFLKRDATTPMGRVLAEEYGTICSLMSYGIMIGGTFSRMRMVQEQAAINGKDYSSVLLKALFQHDFVGINELIADTEAASGVRDIDEMALVIGYERLKMPDVEKLSGKLELNRTDRRLKSKLRNLFASVGVGGISRSPGVIEISAGGLNFAYLLTFGIAAVELISIVQSNPEVLHLLTNSPAGPEVASAVTMGIMYTCSPFIALHLFVNAHEDTHNISSNKNWLGLIPVEVIRKETNPYLAALEEES